MSDVKRLFEVLERGHNEYIPIDLQQALVNFRVEIGRLDRAVDTLLKGDSADDVAVTIFTIAVCASHVLAHAEKRAPGLIEAIDRGLSMAGETQKAGES